MAASFGRGAMTNHWIDMTNAEYKRANMYPEMRFEFADSKTFAVGVHNDIAINGGDFGNVVVNNRMPETSNPVSFVGDKYAVKSGFTKLLYERMTDQNDEDDDQDWCWGWVVNENQRPVSTKPLLLYCLKETPNSIAYLNYAGADSSSDGVGPLQTYTTYIRPSNSVSEYGNTINFGIEYDEFYRRQKVETLFQNYYYDFIVPLYDYRGRMVKVKGKFGIDESITS